MITRFEVVEVVADESRCDGQPEYRRMLAMLHAISLQHAGRIRTEMIKIFAEQLGQAHLCRPHWHALDREIEEVLRQSEPIN